MIIQRGHLFGHAVQVLFDIAHHADSVFHSPGAIDGALIRFESDVIGQLRRPRLCIPALYLGGNVTGDLDHAIEFSGRSEQRVVACLQPDSAAIPAATLKGAGHVLALGKALPEQPIILAVGIVWITKLTMVLSFNLSPGVAEGAQEVVIGCLDLPIQSKFDHRHGGVDGLHDAVQVLLGFHAGGDIPRHLDHFDHLAALIGDWDITGLQPHMGAPSGHSAETSAAAFATGQRLPELVIFGASGIALFAQQTVMPADQCCLSVLQGLLEQCIGSQNMTIGGKFDHRHGCIHGLGQLLCGRQLLLACAKFFLQFVSKHLES